MTKNDKQMIKKQKKITINLGSFQDSLGTQQTSKNIPNNHFQSPEAKINLSTRLKNDDKKLKNILETTTFEYMQNLERNKGFEESVNIQNNKKIVFFKYGPKANTPETLPAKIKEKLESTLKREMEELGYL